MISISPAEEIAAAYQLKRDQKGYFGPCPFHGGNNPRGLTVLHGGNRPVITCHTAACNWKNDILPVLMSDGLARINKDDANFKPALRLVPKPPAFKPIGTNDTPTKAEALAIWSRSVVHHTEMYQHPYYTAKGLPCYDYGARWCEWRGQSTLVIPQYSLPGWAVCGVQLITGNRTDKGGWEKLNRGPRGIGKVGKIAPGSPLVVVEGWTDAAATWEAARETVKHPGIVIAFGRVNPVAANLDLYFNGMRQITALEDND